MLKRERGPLRLLGRKRPDRHKIATAHTENFTVSKEITFCIV